MASWAYFVLRVSNPKSIIAEIVKGHRKGSEFLHKMRMLQAMFITFNIDSPYFHSGRDVFGNPSMIKRMINVSAEKPPPAGKTTINKSDGVNKKFQEDELLM